MFWHLLRLNLGLSLSHILTTIGKRPIRAEPEAPLPCVLCFRSSSPLPPGFLGVSDGKERDLGSISGLGRSPGRGHANPLQYSCLENPHGQSRMVGYSPWGRKSQKPLSNSAQLLSLPHFFLLSPLEQHTHIHTHTLKI